MVPGTVATAVLELVKLTLIPPAGAAEVNVAVPCDAFPPTTDGGLIDTDDSEAGAGCGVTVNVADRVTEPALAVIDTAVEAATALVVTANVAAVAPCVTVTLFGTAATPLLALVNATAKPPEGAAADNVTVPCDGLPPTTVDGFAERPASVAAVGAVAGVNLRTDEKAPAVPEELRPRTRHQCRRAASGPAVNCDAVVV
jgi:hypothetical protein